MDGACGYPPPWARMRAARIAAFRAPSTETHATGTPGGICAIASSASSPSATLFDERSGTPITGRSLYAATTPGSAAAMPAPAMITRTPRSCAVDEYSATPRGLRCADRTFSSCEIPRSRSSASAGSIASRSDSEPTRIPTSGPGSSSSSSRPIGEVCVSRSAGNVHRLRRDVAPEARALERDELARLVCARPRLFECVAQTGHVEDPATTRHELPVPHRGPRVEDDGTERLRLVDAGDSRARVTAFRIRPGGERDRHRARARDRQLHVRQVALRGGE